MSDRLKFAMDSSDGDPTKSENVNICILGDFSGSGTRKKANVFHKIDHDNINDVMQKIGPSVNIVMPDKENLCLEFKSIEDFHPDNLFKHIDFDKYTEGFAEIIKNELKHSKLKSDKPDETAANNSSGKILDSLLSKEVSIKTESNFKEKSIISELLQNAVKSNIVYEDIEGKAIQQKQEELYGILMRYILQTREFKRLEASWLNIDFLLSNLELDEGNINLYIIDLPKDILENDLNAVEQITQTEIFNALRDQFSSYSGNSWSLLIGKYQFSAAAHKDIAILEKIIELTNALHVPFVSAGNLPIPLQFDREVELGKIIKDLGATESLWNKLRAVKGTENVVLTYPEFILRYPYSKKDNAIDSFEFEEIVSDLKHENLLWGNSAFLCCSIVANNEIRGNLNRILNKTIRISDLPLILAQVQGEKIAVPCAEVLIPDRKVDEIEEIGLSPVISIKNDNAVYCKFQTLKR